MHWPDTAPAPFWILFTRLGEAQILLPAAALAIIVLMREPRGRALAAWWVGWLGMAVALTTASKIAFIGWGWGSATLDFTGVSGHAMFAAAVYPLLFAALLPRMHALPPVPAAPPPGTVRSERTMSQGGPWPAAAAGAALALLIGVSRVVVHAHSVSEVVTGLALGGAVCLLALTRSHVPPLRISLWPPALVGLWLVATPAVAPPSHSHEMVTRLALALSGREVPYTRRDLHQRARSELVRALQSKAV